MLCTIVIEDETNCQLNGLDVAHRRELVKRFKFEKPGVRHTPAVKLGRWDGKIPFFNVAGITYINLLPKIIPMLSDWGYEIELDDLRDYRMDYEFDEIQEDTLADTCWPAGHPFAGEPIILRDYQVNAINDFLKNPHGINVLSTAAGKTIITSALSKMCEPYGRTIVIVPNKSLVIQTEEDYVNLGLDVGVFYGDRKEFGKTHTICTWQSLHSLFKQTRNEIADISIYDFVEGVVAVINDETHNAKGDMLLGLLTGPLAKIPLRWGLTGTIPKDEYSQVCLNVCIGEQIGHLGAKELQDKGVLSSCNVNVLQLKDYAVYRDYQSELKYLVTNTERLEYLSDLISDIAQSGNTLVLVDRVATGNHFAGAIEGAIFLSGKDKADDRKEEYDSFKTEDGKVTIATYAIASTGISIVRIKNLVLLESGKSFVRVIQSIGRGLRKGFDKDHVEIWDITSDCKFSKRHLTQRKTYYREVQYPFSVQKIEWKKG